MTEETSNRREATPWWLWPNLLSLDAPLVAVAWLFMISQAWRNELPVDVYVALGLAVWVIYVLDRIYDVWKAGRKDLSHTLEVRHDFHYRNRGWFLLGVIVSIVVLLRLILFVLPQELMLSSWLPLTLTVAYFFVSSRVRPDGRSGIDRVPYVKNALAGFTFAFGVAGAAFSFTQFGFFFVAYREILCMGLLFVLNITVIDVWRELRSSDEPDDSVLLEASVSLPLILLALASLWQMVNLQGGERYIFGALFVSSAALQLLNALRHRFSTDALRTLADVVLILPLPTFFLL